MPTEQAIAEEINDWCEFRKDRAYILMAIARRKFNEDVTNSQEVIHRRVINNEKETEDMVADLLALMDRHDLHFRLYLTVNAHDTLSAYHTFVQQAVGWGEEMMNGHEGTHQKLGRIDSEWKSTLHKPEHKNDAYFLLDFDDVTENEVGKAIAALEEETSVMKLQPTPNGYHVITEPFNYPSWESPVEYDELDTDGMMHIASIDNRGETDG